MELGLVHVYTGDGKGKTTAALGLAMRAIGHGKRVHLVRFLKGGHSGELTTAELLPGMTVEQMNPFTKSIFRLSEEEQAQLAVCTQEAVGRLKESVRGSEYDLYICDEIFGALRRGQVVLAEVLELIQGKAPQVELVLTGRNAPREVRELADYVTVMVKEAHPFDEEVAARRGIEF